MAKFDHDDLINIFNLSGVTGETRKEALRVAEMLAKEKEEEKLLNRQPKKPKGDFVVVLKSPGEIPDGTVASVFVIPNGDDPATLLDSIRSATVTSNLQQKKKKNVLGKFSDILFHLKNKFLKNSNIKRLTKEWCQVLTINPEQDENFIKIEKTAE